MKDPIERKQEMLGNEIDYNDLDPKQHYELSILEALIGNYDDYSDMLNMLKALEDTADTVRDTIRHYQPDAYIPEPKTEKPRLYQLMVKAHSLQNLMADVDEELRSLQDDGNEIIDIKYYLMRTPEIAIISYQH